MTRFFADEMVGKLARLLRAAGYDTLYERSIEDSRLAARADAETRVVLTRHRSFAAKTGCRHVFLVTSTNPFEQLVEVARHFSLDLLSHSFERCIKCNSPLVPTGKQENLDRIPPLVQQTVNDYYACPGCNKLYWKGTHCDSIGRRLEMAQALAQSAES